MKLKQTLISSALAASLLVGAGAALAQNGNGNGPSDPPGIQQPFQGQRGPRNNGNGQGGQRGMMQRPGLRFEAGELLGLAQGYTGLNSVEIRDAQQNGQTLAQLIEANGQSVDDFIAAAVADMNARIDRAVENGNLDAAQAETMKANAEALVTARVNGETPIRDAVRLELSSLLDLAEQYTGLSADEIRSAHQDGQTLAEMITANDQSVDDFIAASVSDLDARIDTAVENGTLDATRAETMKANVEQRVTDFVNGTAPMGPNGMNGGPGPRFAPPAPDDAV